VDHHQAKSVEQGHNWQQEWVGVGREAPNRQMRATEHKQEDQPVGGQVPAQAALLVGLDDEQRGDGDQRGKAQQRQLGIATCGQRRRDRDRWLDLCGHATARQLMPG
jgi:hypothetical protein